MNIGQKIRNAREDMDLYQNDMAKLIPMNQSNYSKIERGLQEPSMEQLRRICQILKINPNFLLELEEFESISNEDLKLLSDVKELIKKHQPKI
ncbi:MAG: helix-turn-helix transcriptional regulator [Clostridia bacterium]|nr:helix-turn-helix transcriptional regulator [Clostridia bacterium]